MFKVDEQKARRVSCVRQTLSKCANFIKDFFDLANAHPRDFIVNNHWNRLLPDYIQKQLLQLSEKDLAKLLTCQHTDHDPSTRRTSFCNDVPCECLDHQFRKNNINGRMIERKDDGNNLQTNKVPQTEMEDQNSVYQDNSNSQIAWKGRSLNQFLSEAQKSCLEGLASVCTSVDELLSWLREGVNVSQETMPFMHAYMKVKKEHEVEIMAAVCTCLFHKCSADMVVDLGSGKGYLSIQLALHSGLPVVGIDSQANNTSGARRRAEKLGTQLHYLVKNEIKNQTQNEMKGESNCSRSKSECTSVMKEGTVLADSHRDIASGLPVLSESDAACDIEGIDHGNKSHLRPDALLDKNCLEVTKDYRMVPVEKCQVSHTLSESRCRESSPAFKDKNNMLSSETPRRTNLNRNMHSLTILGAKSNNEETQSSKHAALTMCVGQDTRLTDIAYETASIICPHKEPENLRLLLTGLHTCGGLGSCVMRLFVNDSAVAGVCAVGCCYQLMQEKFSDNCLSENDKSTQAAPDFPMSSLLLDSKVYLGRSACNTASLSLPRMRNREQLHGQTFYPRALLQAIIHEKIGQVPTNLRNLRNLSKQCGSPCDYVVKALYRLDIPDCQASEEEVADFHERHKHQEHKMAAFYQLQAVLAPVIESVILLDRLLYLLEQDCVKDAFVVKLFDPVASPRCYAIIATKNC